MRLTIREDSSNYACTVVKLPPKQAVAGLDNLVKVTVFGNDVLTKKDADENILYLFFPAECVISAEYLSKNNEFRNNTLNDDPNQKGYFEENGRVKAIKFKGVISTGYLAPLKTLYIRGHLHDTDFEDLKVGDEFTDINGINICKKYIPKHIYAPGQGGKESRHNKKLKRFDKLVPNQFRFHQDTSHLAKNLHLFNPDDIIVITDKWHGTSAVFGNVLVNVDLGWYERIILKVAETLLGKKIARTKYDQIYSSRSVVKNQYINKEQGGGYYGEDIWAVVNKELEGKIEQGITLYGEIVGYLPSGKEIQKGYDYGCYSTTISPGFGAPEGAEARTYGNHRFLVYRITYTKPNGEVIEYSWNMIREYCKKYSIEHVKELYFGKAGNTFSEGWRDKVIDILSKDYLEKDCTYCKNKVPAEGVCVRIDGKSTYSTFKLKAKRFLERETKSLDAGEVSIEDEQTTSNHN
jgi:hypothetical protein